MAREKLEVPEEVLAGLGLDVEELKKDEKIWKALEYGEKTPLLMLQAEIGERAVPVPAKIHLWEKNGIVMPFIHIVRPSIDLRPYKDREFSPEEKTMLTEENLIDHPISLKFGDKDVKCLIGVDSETREVCHIPVQNVWVRDNVLGVDVDDKQKEIIKNGGKVLLTGLHKGDEKPWDAVCSYDFARKGLIFRTPTPKLLQQVRIYAGESAGKEAGKVKEVDKGIDKKPGKSVTASKNKEKKNHGPRM